MPDYLKRDEKMISSYPVIYLTGAPASGKSTLGRRLKERFPGLAVFAYSEELRKKIAGRDRVTIGEDTIREQSSRLVTAQDVLELDEHLIMRVERERSAAPFLIDSHPVTKELYGYRVTAFSLDQIRRLAPDVIVCLYVSANETVRRISANAMGRPMVSLEDAAMHTQLQAAAAIQYGTLLGKPVYLIDSSIGEDALVERVAQCAKLS